MGEELRQYLVEQGASVKIISAAKWQTSQSVGEILNAYLYKGYKAVGKNSDSGAYSVSNLLMLF